MLADLRPAGVQGRPLAELAELLGVGLRGPGDPLTLSGVTVSGVTHDSRRVRPGDLYAALPGGHVEGFGDTFGALFRAIYADIAAGRPNPDPAYATFAAGHDEMLVNDAIAESARVGRWVDVDRSAAGRSRTAAHEEVPIS